MEKLVRVITVVSAPSPAMEVGEKGCAGDRGPTPDGRLPGPPHEVLGSPCHSRWGCRAAGGVRRHDSTCCGRQAVPPVNGQPGQDPGQCLCRTSHRRHVLLLMVAHCRSQWGGRVGFFDWAFLSNVLLAGVTGVATEAMRTANIRPAAYPVYFVHLVIVLVLILTLPYTKLAHAVYRVMALAGEEHTTAEQAAMASPGVLAVGGAGPEDRVAPGDEAPARGDEAAGPSPEELLAMSHAELCQYPDAVLEDAYYKLARSKRATPRWPLLPEHEEAGCQRAGTGKGPAGDRCPGGRAWPERVGRVVPEGGGAAVYLVAGEPHRGSPCPDHVPQLRHVHVGLPGGRALRRVRPPCHRRHGPVGRRRAHHRPAQVQHHLVLRTMRFLQFPLPS